VSGSNARGGNHISVSSPSSLHILRYRCRAWGSSRTRCHILLGGAAPLAHGLRCLCLARRAAASGLRATFRTLRIPRLAHASMARTLVTVTGREIATLRAGASSLRRAARSVARCAIAYGAAELCCLSRVSPRLHKLARRIYLSSRTSRGKCASVQSASHRYMAACHTRGAACNLPLRGDCTRRATCLRACAYLAKAHVRLRGTRYCTRRKRPLYMRKYTRLAPPSQTYDAPRIRRGIRAWLRCAYTARLSALSTL